MNAVTTVRLLMLFHKEKCNWHTRCDADPATGDQNCGTLAGLRTAIAERHAAGIQDARWRGHEAGAPSAPDRGFCRRQGARRCTTRLVAVDFIQNNRGRPPSTDCASCSAGRACVDPSVVIVLLSISSLPPTACCTSAPTLLSLECDGRA